MHIGQRSTWTTSVRCLKSQRIYILRFLIIVALVLIGVYASLKSTRTVGADSTHKAAPPPVSPTLHGPAALKHLEQTGLYSSLSAAVTAAEYRIDERKAGSYEASNPKQRYRTVFTRAGVEVSGAGRNGSDWRLGMHQPLTISIPRTEKSIEETTACHFYQFPLVALKNRIHTHRN